MNDKSLRRDSVTVSSRIMLPFFPAAFGALGLIYTLQSPDRTMSPFFDLARALVPMRGWGVLFLMVAGVEAWALLTNNRRLYILALIPGAFLAGFWSVLIGSSGFFSPAVSFSAGIWCTFAVAAQAAAARTLAKGER